MLASDQQRAAMSTPRWPLLLRNPFLSKLARVCVCVWVWGGGRGGTKLHC